MDARRWYARFPAGFSPVVARVMAARDPACALSRAWEESILFSSNQGPGKRLKGSFSALYRVVDSLDGQVAVSGERDFDAGDAAARFTKALLDGRGDAPKPAPRAGGRRPRFRARILFRNEPRSVPEGILSGLEKAFARRSGMEADRRGSGAELTVLVRDEGPAFLLFRPDPSDGADVRKPEAGELPPHTARLLCECSGPADADVFLDPFAGGGSIPLERALMAPFGMVFAQDADPERFAAMKARLSALSFKAARRRIFPKLRDALDLSAFEDGYVSAIVTDPPWGLWEKGPRAGEARDLLSGLMEGARRALSPEGRLVLLLERGLASECAEKSALPGSGYALAERLDVLISGRKASVLRFSKRD
jgi:hypothetical protein